MEEERIALIEAAADLLKTDVSKPGVDDELKATRIIAGRFLREQFNTQVFDSFRIPVVLGSAVKESAQ